MVQNMCQAATRVKDLNKTVDMATIMAQNADTMTAEAIIVVTTVAIIVVTIMVGISVITTVDSAHVMVVGDVVVIALFLHLADIIVLILHTVIVSVRVSSHM